MRFKELFNDDLTVNCEKVESVPEFAKLKGCPQHVEWHREGDAWQHTMCVVFSMQTLFEPKDNGYLPDFCKVSDDMKRILMYAALCHDLGKPETTKQKKDGHWGAKYHDDLGARIVRTLFREDCDTPLGQGFGKADGNLDLTFAVANLTALHMKLHHLIENRETMDEETVNTYLTNLDRWCYLGIQPLILMSLADDLGSDNEYDTEFLAQSYDFINKKCKELKLGQWREKKTDKSSEKNDFTCTMMMGIPGAGKSSYTDTMHKEANIFSNDAVRRIDLGIENNFGTPEQEKEIRKLCWNKIEAACKAKQNFVVDNTNISKWVRQRIAREVWANNGTVNIVFLDASLDECLKRRYNIVPEETVRSMDRHLDLPTFAEADTITIIRGRDAEPPKDYSGWSSTEGSKKYVNIF